MDSCYRKYSVLNFVLYHTKVELTLLNRILTIMCKKSHATRFPRSNTNQDKLNKAASKGYNKKAEESESKKSKRKSKNKVEEVNEQVKYKFECNFCAAYYGSKKYSRNPLYVHKAKNECCQTC